MCKNACTECAQNRRFCTRLGVSRANFRRDKLRSSPCVAQELSPGLAGKYWASYQLGILPMKPTSGRHRLKVVLPEQNGKAGISLARVLAARLCRFSKRLIGSYMASTPEHLSSLLAIARASLPLMQALEAARSLRLQSWCIGAGAVRNCVWDYLHGYSAAKNLDEVDLVYFDDKAAPEDDAKLQQQLSQRYPFTCWDVANQAHVHRWYELQFGTPVEPLYSLEQGIATWPEFATCVGVSLQDDDSINVIAPFGLQDLFELKVRHNTARASAVTFATRHKTKRWLHRWPKLTICSSSGNAT